MVKEELGREFAAKQVQEDVAHYKRTLERNRTQYKIVDEQLQEYGSVILKVIKQYNQCPVGTYLD